MYCWKRVVRVARHSQDQLTSSQVDHSNHFLCLSPLSVHIFHLRSWLLACHQNSSLGRKAIAAGTHLSPYSLVLLFPFLWSVSTSKASITRELQRCVTHISRSHHRADQVVLEERPSPSSPSNTGKEPRRLLVVRSAIRRFYSSSRCGSQISHISDSCRQ